LLTRTTAILGTAFFVLSLGLAILYKGGAADNAAAILSGPAPNIPGAPAPGTPASLPPLPADAQPAPAVPAPVVPAPVVPAPAVPTPSIPTPGSTNNTGKTN
jgi:hypothetical protein